MARSPGGKSPSPSPSFHSVRSRTMSRSPSPARCPPWAREEADQNDGSDDFSIIKAAGEESILKLRKLLDSMSNPTHANHYDLSLQAHLVGEGPDACWQSALLQAIANKRLENVKLLLSRFADPNGISCRDQEEYSRRFRRMKVAGLDQRRIPTFITHNDVGDVRTQLFPLMDHELQARKTTVTRFWTHVDTLPFDFCKNGDRLHSLVMAAHNTGEDALAIFNLLESKADASCWKGRDCDDLFDFDLPPSALSLTTPLHAAVGNHEMMRNMLYRDYDPNARALIAGCQALTPMQEAIRRGDLASYKVLQEHPSADVDMSTPVFRAHLLHFAVATLNYDVLARLSMRNVAATALGHNLAHIACMAEHCSELQLQSRKVACSIHDVRSVDDHWERDAFFYTSRTVQQYKSPSHPHADGPGNPGSLTQAPFLGLPLHQRQQGLPTSNEANYVKPATGHFAVQMDVVKYLIERLGISIMSQEDYCGNTPLHYLASMRVANDKLIAWLRSFSVCNTTWHSSENNCNHTPSALWVDSLTTLEMLECDATDYPVDGPVEEPHAWPLCGASCARTHRTSMPARIRGSGRGVGRGRGRGRGRGFPY